MEDGGHRWPLAEVVRLISGITLEEEGNIRRYTTTAAHGPGHFEVIYARNVVDRREELAVGLVAPPVGRAPVVKGYGPADMLAKLRRFDGQGYDPAIMGVVRDARDYLRHYVEVLLG